MQEDEGICSWILGARFYHARQADALDLETSLGRYIIHKALNTTFLLKGEDVDSPEE